MSGQKACPGQQNWAFLAGLFGGLFWMSGAMSGLPSPVFSSEWQPQHDPPAIGTHNPDDATLLGLG